MRLINADALKLAIPETSVDAFQNCRNCVLLDKEQVNELIDAAPTIDIDRPTRSQFKRMAVQLGYEPVVHCKGCQYWGNEETKVATVCGFPRVQLFCVCDVLKRMRKAGNCMTNEDFFCAHGERRADFVDDNKIGERKNNV